MRCMLSLQHCPILGRITAYIVQNIAGLWLLNYYLSIRNYNNSSTNSSDADIMLDETNSSQSAVDIQSIQIYSDEMKTMLQSGNAASAPEYKFRSIKEPPANLAVVTEESDERKPFDFKSNHKGVKHLGTEENLSQASEKKLKEDKHDTVGSFKGDEAMEGYHHDMNETEQGRSESNERIQAQKRIENRMRRIKILCDEMGDPFYHVFNLYFFKSFSSNGITWCPSFKAGSSTWRDFFIDHVLEPDATFNKMHYHLGALRHYALGQGRRGPRGRIYPSEPPDSIRFTIVRHPISRLISHLHKAQNYPYEVKRQRRMWTEEAIVNGRTDSSWDDETEKRYRDELTKYVDELEPPVEHAPYSKDNPYLHPPYPTFVEMIDFMMKHRKPAVDNKGANGHWRSAVEWCDICENDFNIIIQLEEPAELMILLEKLDMLQFKDAFMKKHNSSGNTTISGQVIQNYINLLTREQIEFLNEMYATDFQLLGYEPI